MKRDERLQGLSSEHHHALRLARRVTEACRRHEEDEALAQEVDQEWHDTLGPHFTTEEELMLPALEGRPQAPLARRTRDEHAMLREHLRAALAGDHGRLADFAKLLHDHVRFEERELFPACEEVMGADALALVAERHPHPR